MLALLMLTNVAYAQTSQGTTSSQVCQSIIQAYTTSTVPQSQGSSSSSGASITVNIASFTSLIVISLLIISLMGALIAIIYAVGQAFGIDRLTRFAKAEVGEIAITLLIIFIFLGTLSLTGTFTNSSSLFAAAGSSFNTNIFVDDCNAVMASSYSLISPELSFVIDSGLINIASGTVISTQLSDFGVSFNPFAGDEFLGTILQTLISIGGVMIGLLFGIGVFLAVIYGMFPMFLFAGIVLRTLPFTRPAGGAFLGLFVGFYIFLPLILHFLLFYNSTFLTQSQNGLCGPSSCNTGDLITQFVGYMSGGATTALTGNSITSGLNGASTFGTSTISLLNGSIIQAFVSLIIEPVFYTMLAFILSLIMAYDFMEAVGDLLGAPSLKSSAMLKNVI
jgi:hypothetical protein